MGRGRRSVCRESSRRRQREKQQRRKQHAAHAAVDGAIVIRRGRLDALMISKSIEEGESRLRARGARMPSMNTHVIRCRENQLINNISKSIEEGESRLRARRRLLERASESERDIETSGQTADGAWFMRA